MEMSAEEYSYSVVYSIADVETLCGMLSEGERMWNSVYHNIRDVENAGVEFAALNCYKKLLPTT